MPFAVGETVGPYRILEQLGQGGMATVFKAYHAALDRYVAIKALHPAFMEDPNFLARFQREARVVAKLEHPNIVPIYDYADDQGRPYLVMKFVEGQTLKARLARAPLSRDEILHITEAVGVGLAYAHRAGILHRDVKPSNVLLTPDNQVYLADFGLARIAAAGESTISSDMMVGTPQYISPEQAKGERNLDEGTDIYSFGVLLYEIVVGRVPFSSDTPYSIIHDHIYSPLPLPRQMNPNVPEAVERVLLKALAKERADRYATVQDLVQAFTAALLSESAEQHQVATPAQPAPETLVAPARTVEQKTVASQATTQPDSTPPPLPKAATAPPQSVAPATPLQPVAVPVEAAAQPITPAAPKPAGKKIWRILIPVFLIVFCLCGFVGVRILRQGGMNPVEQARRGVSENPEDPWAHYNLAVALSDANQWDEAQSEYNMALSLGGNDLEFYASIGEDMISVQAWPQAAQAYVYLAERSPKPLPQEIILPLHESLYKAAPETAFLELLPLERIDTVDPGFAAVVEARHALHTGGPVRIAAAQEIIDRVLERNPDHPEALLVQAELFLQRGDAPGTRSIVERLLTIPELPEWVTFEAQMLLEQIKQP